MENQERVKFWGNVLAGADMSPRQNVKLVGVSGFEHFFPVVGYSNDEKSIALILPEPDVVKGALIANDIRLTNRISNVSVIRPTIANSNKLIETIISKIFELKLQGIELKAYFEESAAYLSETMKNLATADESRPVDGEELLKVANGMLFEDLARAAIYSRELTGVLFVENVAQLFREVMAYDLPRIFANDQFNMAEVFPKEQAPREIQWGICPLPLQDFTDQAWKALLDPENTEQAQIYLKEIGFYQFFRPPIDQSALALVERGVNSVAAVTDIIEQIDAEGHPHDDAELVSGYDSMDSLIDKLHAKGLTVGGSMELELSSDGRKERFVVQFQPREALFFKMIQQIPLLKDLVAIFKRS